MGGTVSVCGDIKGKGNEHFKAGRYADAVLIYSQALDADPQDHTVHSNRSAARLKLNQPGFAVSDALSCVSLAPTWPKGYFRLGQALTLGGKHAAATECFRKALALTPDDAAVRVELEKTEKLCLPGGRSYVYTWGATEATGRGDGGRAGASNATPKQLDGAVGRQVRDLACGLAHTVLVTEGGEVLAWGENKYSQCGTSGTTPVARPVFLGALLGVRIRSVACGGAHSAVISETGKIYSWGMGASGQLGHGARAQVALPTPIAALSGTRILATTCGFGHTLIVTEAGSLLACGWNSSGQCGTAGGSDALVPTEIRLPGRATVQHASCGAGHSAVVTHAGALYTFGSGSCGQLGHGDSTDSPSPKRVEALSGEVVAMVACGEEFTLALSANRAAFAFGLNNVGQLGIPTKECETRATPGRLAALDGKSVHLLRCTQSQVMAVTADGQALTWGSPESALSPSGGALSSEQIKALLSGSGEGTAGIGDGGATGEVSELSWFRKKKLETVECGRRHLVALLRGTSAAETTVTGGGAETATAGKRAKFSIEARDTQGDKMDAGGDRFDALLFTDDGDCHLNVEVDDNMDGSYSGSYTATKAGAAMLWVTLGAVPIHGSPFRVAVHPAAVSSKASEASALFSSGSGCHEVGEVASVWVRCRDIHGNATAAPKTGEAGEVSVSARIEPKEGAKITVKAGEVSVTASIEPKEGAKIAVKVTSEVEKDGRLRFFFSPDVVGSLEVRVTVGGVELATSPIEASVVPGAVDPSKCFAEGPGLEGAKCGDGASFDVVLRDRFGNPALDVKDGYASEFVESANIPMSIAIFETLKDGGHGARLSGVDVSSRGIQLGKGYRESAFEVFYSAFKTGTLSVQVTVRGKPLFPTPKKVVVSAGPTSALYSVASGDGLEGAGMRGTALERSFSLEARDDFDNPTARGEDAWEARLKPADAKTKTVAVLISDQGNGTYACSYTVSQAGAYSLEIWLGKVGSGQEAAGSPFAVAFSPDPKEEVRRRHHQQEARFEREKLAKEARRTEEAERRDREAAAGLEREAAHQEERKRMEEAKQEREAAATVRRAAEAEQKEKDKAERLAERLRKEEQVRRRAAEEAEAARASAAENLRLLEARRARPGSATSRTSGGFTVSFTGDGSTRREAWTPSPKPGGDK